MSNQEFSRLKVIQDLISDAISPRHAAQLIGLSTRQVRTLRRRFIDDGPAGLVSKHRGRPSNRTTTQSVKEEVLRLLRTHYADFGPTFAAEKLKEKHGFTFSPATVRIWMKQDGLWSDRRSRSKAIHQPRQRRECYGELVQIDGSQHWWFENRGPRCTLLVYIDDATSKIMQLKFVACESAFAYFASTTEYVTHHGKPVAFYSDKHSIFRVTKKDAVGGDGMTQFGRALHELNIDIICANTPQAKGRVERANRTLQDRLVKELRLAGICSMEDGNKFLPQFMADYNARFAKEPCNPKNLHRFLNEGDNLGAAFVWREERTVSGSLTLQYDRTFFILEPTEVTKALPRKRVTVSEHPDGRVVIAYQGLPLAYRIFDTVRHVDQGAIVENKRLGPVLDHIRQQQALRPQYRSERGPRRRDQANPIFEEGARLSAKRRKRRFVKPIDLPAGPASPRLDGLLKRISGKEPLSHSGSKASARLSYEDGLCMARRLARPGRAD